MWMTRNRKKESGAQSPARPPGRVKRLWRKSAAVALAAGLLSGGIIATTPPAPAEALARGEQMSFPYVGVISNFILPDGSGRRAYCIEVQMGEPNGSHAYAGRLTYLPGQTGMFPAYSSVEGMRQMNYIISKFGQTGNAYTSAVTQIAVWAIRGDTAYFSDKYPKLMMSTQGQAAVRDAQLMINEAKAQAKAPSTPKAITGKLSITDDPNGVKGRYRVAYPKGVTQLSATNGKWVRNKAATLPVEGDLASARYIDVTKAGTPIKVTATWESKGTVGYEPTLFVWNTSTANGAQGQRVAVATGSSTKAALKGTLAAEVPTKPKDGFVEAVSQAQPSAEVLGTAKDTLIVSPAPGTTPVVWPNAVADFTAYLQPEVGATKVDESWNPVLGAPYDAQAEDPDTGELLWTTWWTKADGTPVVDGAGAPIPVVDAGGNPSAGTAPDGTVYPVAQVDGNGDPVLDGTGNPVFYTDRSPVMEQRRDPVKWTKAELDAMTSAQQCVAQPVYREGGIPVTKIGRYDSQPVTVKSAGTINWVDRVRSNGNTVHESRCGIANERTKVGQPGVVTTAVPKVNFGEEAFDMLHFTGTLVPGVEYEARVDAYQAPKVDPANPQPVVPVCEAENRIYRSPKVPVTSTADLKMPGFIYDYTYVDEDHEGEQVWFTHSFYANGELIDEGACGLPDETTVFAVPTFSTEAITDGVVGDELTDTIIAEGDFTPNENAKYSATFTAYHETYKEIPSQSPTPAPGEEMVKVPVCEADNAAFTVDTPTEITGPGRFTSTPVVARPEHAGKLWWVEKVSLTQGDNSTVIHTGACGLANETTVVTVPDVVTQAAGFAVIADEMTDTAKITGKLTERAGVTHDVVFEGYVGDPKLTGTDKATCDATNLAFTTDPVAVPVESKIVDGVETREVTSPGVMALPTHGTTVWWVEKLRQKDGEKVTEVSKGKCGLPNETTTITKPSVKTKSAGIRKIGTEMFDTAIVAGKFPKNPNATFAVTFKAYKYGADGELTCSPEAELKAFEDATGVKVDKPGEYRSKGVVTTMAHVGVGGYVETLTMTVNKKTYDVHVGKCGEASEKFEVLPPDELSVTGGTDAWYLWAGGGALLLFGGAAIAIAVRRKQRPALANERSEMI